MLDCTYIRSLSHTYKVELTLTHYPGFDENYSNGRQLRSNLCDVLATFPNNVFRQIDRWMS